MKKLLMTLLLVAAGSSLLLAQPAEIWVSPDGNDRAEGTREEPLQSVNAALRKGREMRRRNNPLAENGVKIIVRGGEYPLYEPIYVRPEDSGSPGSPTVVTAAPGEIPAMQGGVAVTGWRKADNVAGLPRAARGKVWVAPAPLNSGRPFEFRQMWVNGVKAVRARETDPDHMNIMVSWDRKKEEFWIVTPKADIKNGDPSPMEITIHQRWAIAHCRIKEIEIHGDSTLLKFHDLEARVQFEHPWPEPFWRRGRVNNSPYYLSNALCFLDEPGEWFYDYKTQQVYYWPREGENLATANVVVPRLETLMQVQGSLDRPIRDISFEGIKFEYTTWTRPSEKGHIPLQAGMYLIDAYNLKPNVGTPEKESLCNQAWHGRPPGAVTVSAAENIAFRNCRFEHLGSAGLDILYGTKGDLIEGCLFRDLAGNGIQYGKLSDETFEAHLVYDPHDVREVSQNGTIVNNLITDCGNEDWGSCGIVAGCVRGLTIRNNELCELPYSAISLGWGWIRDVGVSRDNTVKANYIHHYARHVYDTGGVYTLSASPGTVVSENRIEEIYYAPYAHAPDLCLYLYTDEGSAYMSVVDNWCPEEKFLQNNNGPNVIFERNGPSVPDEIKNAAGLEPPYRYLLDLY